MLIKLTKTIELLEDLEIPPKTAKEYDTLLAARLGLAGLKAIRFYRNGGRWDFKALLEGEQPEEIVK